MDTETEKNIEIEMEKKKNENENESAGDYKFPIWMPFRRKFTPDGSFFAPGNAERELLAKQATLELTEDENAQISVLQCEEFGDLPCPIIGCGARLSAITILKITTLLGILQPVLYALKFSQQHVC